MYLSGSPHFSPRPGSWPSPVSADRAVTLGRNLEAVAFAGAQVWWSEGRPAEGGRICVCTCDSAGRPVDLLAPPWNARTRVHEYGGTAWIPVPGASDGAFDLVFAELTDQRLYRIAPGSAPRPLTPAPQVDSAWRYADFALDARRDRLLAVRESHRGDGTVGTVDRTLVAIPLDGTAAADATAVVDLLATEVHTDFVAAPRFSPSADALLWISWNHPDMPWDSTTVHLAAVGSDGRLQSARPVAGGPGVSAVDPGFLPDGSVVLISDETDWWQPVLLDPRSGAQRRLSTVEADFARPLWVLGQRNWAPVTGGRLLLTPAGRPSVLDTFTGELTEVDPSWTSVADLATDRSGRMAVIAGSDEKFTELVLLEPDGARRVLRSAADEPLPAEFVPRPQERVFDGVHAIVYPPTNPGHRAEPGTAPVVLTVHGGPTAQHSRTLSAGTAYFTSRGFAVAAVDYRGSTGYGRRYRDALKGRWAELDIADAMTVARGLLADGTAGAAVITGGSAGGLTVLGALTVFGNPFSAGVSHYGVGDLESLAASIHDFESGYLTSLLGEEPAVLRDRSPLHRAGRLVTPVLLLQGENDPIVPPGQARSFAAACAENNVPHAVIVFSGEGHGFREAAHRKAALKAELAFYGQVLGFDTPGVPAIDLV